MGATRGDKTWEFKGSRDVFIREAKKDLEKRQFTLQMTYFAEEPGDYPRVLPVVCFKATPEGYDEEDSDREGDVEVAPGLAKDERDDYDDRVILQSRCGDSPPRARTPRGGSTPRGPSRKVHMKIL